MPGVINGFKIHQLKVQFEHADSLLSEAFQRSVQEFGYTDVSEFTIPSRKYTPEKWEQLVSDTALLNEIWLNQFPGKKKITKQELQKKNIVPHKMLGESIAHLYDYTFFVNGVAYILPNGISVTPLAPTWAGVGTAAPIVYRFDTNGPYKGPNRLGYDIFVRYTEKEGYYTPFCNPLLDRGSSDSNNCYYWAHNKQNPVYKSKSYWDLLFKPEEYFQNGDR